MTPSSTVSTGHRQGQTKKHSWYEAWSNIVVGFTINYCANLLIFPLFGLSISLVDNFILGLIYTVISVLRSYYLRRVYNWCDVHNVWEKLSGRWNKVQQG